MEQAVLATWPTAPHEAPGMVVTASPVESCVSTLRWRWMTTSPAARPAAVVLWPTYETQLMSPHSTSEPTNALLLSLPGMVVSGTLYESSVAPENQLPVV